MRDRFLGGDAAQDGDEGQGGGPGIHGAERRAGSYSGVMKLPELRILKRHTWPAVVCMSTPTVAPLPARIKTRQLVLLTHIDRTGSVLAAADAAGMSQPAASKLLRELEQTLGVALFERHARGVVATACGEAVIRHA